MNLQPYTNHLNQLKNEVHLLSINKKEKREDVARYEKSYFEFFKDAWPYIWGNTTPIDGWHIQAICEHLQACFTGEIKYLIINVPPRTYKSSTVTIGFPAWCWINRPTSTFMYSSYSREFATEHSIACRRLVMSPWYTEKWPIFVKSESKRQNSFKNVMGGSRLASSINSISTGLGADFQIADDPNYPEGVFSEAIRKGVIRWWDGTMSTRTNNPGGFFCRILVQQRLHEQDLSGHILSQMLPNVVHLRLPMEYEARRPCMTVPLLSTNGKPWVDPRVEEGELLWPERMNQQEVNDLKRNLKDPYNISGQLQQRPSPPDGGIIKTGWFKPWKHPTLPPIHFILQSWDTALSDDVTASYSACTSWGLFNSEPYTYAFLLNVWRGRVEYPDLKHIALNFSKNIFATNPLKDDKGGKFIMKPHMVVVEAKASGLSLIQDLRRMGIPIRRFDPTPYGNKIQRARFCSSWIQDGEVFVPMMAPHFVQHAPHAELLLDCVRKFPTDDETKDVVDSMSQALIVLRDLDGIQHKKDKVIQMPTREERSTPYYA